MAAGVQHRASPRSVGDEDASEGVYRPSPRSRRDPEALDHEGREIRRVLAHGKISFMVTDLISEHWRDGTWAGRSARETDRVVVRPPCYWAHLNAGNDEL